MNQTRNQARDWVSFWDKAHSIYVNARHFDVHYRDIAAGILALLPAADLRVLDYGCGEALHADRVAARAAKLYLCESAPTVREHLSQRFGANGKIVVVAPEDVARMAEASLDVIVANSLVQYLASAEFDRLLALWRRLLAPGGVLIVGDVIPPNVSPLSDVLALLRYAARNGFFFAAIFGLARTLVSDYRAVRSKLGIACYSEAEFLARLAGAGFAPERLAVNLEHNPARMSFRARLK
jgi:SAM-dependent methyltransferase